MEWILVFLDTLFGGLVAESEWFDRIAKKFTGSVENLVYSVESGSMDASGLSQKVERLVHWLPIVFLICLALDLVIRSRFVRYSYRDENQAKKSVWWRWQSDTDAALALEEASRQAMLPQKGMQETAAPDENAETVETVEAAEAAEAEAPPENAQEVSDDPTREDGIDRGMITDARQNRLHDQSAIAQRAQDAATDLQDRFTIFKSALLFLPKAAAMRAQMTKRSVKDARERASQRSERAPRAISGRDAQAEADAFFSQGMQNDYVDGDYTSGESVSTGGIDDYSFADAAQVIREATGAGDTPPVRPAPKKKKPKNLKKRVRITFVGKKPKASAQTPAEKEQADPAEEKSEE